MSEEGTIKDGSYYKQFVVRHYKHWTLQIEEKQRYLGQAVAWLNRDGDMQRLSSLTKEERTELWESVLPDYEEVVEKLWQPDHMNYVWLGNFFHMHKGHGHMHLIPRYESSRTFEGREFVDDRWGKNYVPYSQDALPIEVALSVREAFISQLSQ